METLGGIHNVLPIIIATTTALLVVELSGLEDFTDTVIAAKIRSIKKGMNRSITDAAVLMRMVRMIKPQ
jgi:hypothetical protein